MVTHTVCAQSSRKAINHTIKAIGKAPLVREIVKAKKYKVDHQVKKMGEFLGDNAAVVIAIGVVSKLAIDRKIGYKTKIGKNSNYKINLNASGEISSGFYGRVENLKDSTYDVIAYSKGADQGLRVGIKITFD